MKVDSGGGPCDISFGSATSPEAPSLAVVPPTNQKININFDSSAKTYVEEKKTTVVSRFPTHEPFPDHIRKAQSLEIPVSVKTGDSGLTLPGTTSLFDTLPGNVNGSIIPGGAFGEFVGAGFVGNQAIYDRIGDVTLVSPSSLNSIGDAGFDLIKQKEGFLANVQPDIGGGASVIGFGHTLSLEELKTGTININGVAFPVKDGLSKDAASALLQQDIQTRFAPVVDQNVLVDLTQNQKDALVSFSYNVGESNFKNSTLLKKLNTGDYASVTDEMMRWTYATDPKTGTKIKFNGLTTRRQAEADLFSS